jgi:hypothetical protein
MKEKNEREVIYDVIQAFYQSKPEDTNINYQVEKTSYYLGDLFFYDTTVLFIPRDFKNPNFKENLDGIVNILKREEYKFISKEELMKLE